jgi:hypothetical protein
MTTTDILQQYAPDILAIAELDDKLKVQLQRAMLEYAIAFYCKASGQLDKYIEASKTEHPLE